MVPGLQVAHRFVLRVIWMSEQLSLVCHMKNCTNFFFVLPSVLGFDLGRIKICVAELLLKS